MKKLVYLFASCVISIPGMSQIGILDKVKKAASKDSSGGVISAVSKVLPVSDGKTNLSNEEIINGLKQALSVGTENSAKKLSATDGFFKDAAIKILMPEEAQKVEKTLRKFGMSSLVDKAILSMNRAAEDAASGVGQIFLNAIKGMTLTAGLKVLRGGDHAATDYLKANTSQGLTEKMRPIIDSSLKKVNATAYWKDVFSNYNKFSREKVNTDLSAYVTERAMSGIFYSIAQEELKIRKDPAARVTDLLKKVFN